MFLLYFSLIPFIYLFYHTQPIKFENFNNSCNACLHAYHMDLFIYINRGSIWYLKIVKGALLEKSLEIKRNNVFRTQLVIE